MKKILLPGRHSAVLICGFLILFLCGSAFGQAGRSTVRGTVTDPQGAAVVGATVNLTNNERSFTRTQTTSGDGGYVFSAVPPGTYRIEVEAQGFKKTAVAEVNALVDTTVEQNIQLELGNVTEVVTIASGSEAPLNTTDATIGNAFEQRRIEELPLNARNVVGLLSLQPGVTRTGYVNGGRADQANVMLDGVDNNEQQQGLDVVTDEAFASVLRSTPDSLQEFRVITTNPNAEQGRSSGAQVSLVTKSGTNEYHGSLYEYHRNTVTTANDFFNNAAGSFGPDDLPVQLGQKQVGDPRVPRPQLLRNVFGGSIGGPIRRDRAFFFFTYEGFREASETTVVREVPLPTLGQGIVRYRTESGTSDPTCPAGTPAGVRCLSIADINAGYQTANFETPGVNPTALAFLANAASRYPANDTSVGDGLNTAGFRFNAKTPARLNTYITRMDFNLTDRQTLFMRGNYQSDNVTHNVYGGPDCGLDFTADNIQCFPDTPALTIWNHPWGIAFGHSWTPTNNFVNRFTYGYTRAAFTNGGESTENQVAFRFIFVPQGYRRSLSRVTPVHNFVDDISWIKGNHTLGLGGNVRLIKNSRTSFGSSFDNAVINPSYYNFSGAVLIEDANGDPIFPDVGGDTDSLRDALASVIGRYSQYSALLVYDQSGQLQTVGTPTERTFATEEYELYFQDSWRVRPNLTFSYGLRWSTSTPVYEKNGLQVKPTQSLGQYFRQRVESSEQGVPFNDPVTFDLAGKANNRPGYYKQDWNNFAPSISFAWSPDLGDNFFGRLVGRNGRSVIRGGFRMTYDRIGSQLAVNFDLNNLAGFTSARNINANTFDVCCGPDALGPLFTGINPNVRSLDFPGSTGPIPTTLSFPLTVPADEDQRIEVSLDDTITTPYNYSVNFSYGRELGKGLSFEASYVGRFARNLLAQRDIMQLNNIRDPQSGMTFYEAMNLLIDARYQNRPITSLAPIPYFENLFPFMPEWWEDTSLTPTQAAYAFIAPQALGGADITDYTFIQLLWDDSPNCTSCPFGGGPARVNNMFYQPQFAALSAFSTIARSNYNALQLSLRQRFSADLAFDFNYTLSHSLDNASGLQSSANYGTAFIVNALNPDLAYASSDFDARHIINANWLVGLPFGRGKAFFGNAPKAIDTILGGWQTTGIFRWNSGLPVLTPFDCCVWATNWNVQSNGVRVRPIQSSTTSTGSPNLFTDPVAAYRSFRNARSGEIGDRNVLRGQSYISLDVGLMKNFKLPWEGHNIQFRWEVFNLTNTQRFDANTISDLSLRQDPFLDGTPDPNFGRFTSTQTPLNESKAGRVMQFALRYQF
ncbi:MAG TPA: carboxypeptidase-like regulatory domain-containing protein [Pyrinomonadaceae bacterium]|nr:carboxypeptidase-like regulatory domain-containing protein [Pyrinomonadaceae bacterium]